ncbi:DUF4192 family protein [Glycomyces sp. MUSA5-2]|uniref:DUF4192 family protein n=1 Tax=Glycomyces sp. MUSA5-2 TaxID=2053002 RepID=UPI00300920D6
MYLRSYAASGVGTINLLNPGVVAALAPVLLGRAPVEEIVGIGSWGATTGALASWPLADLDTEDAADRFIRVFTAADCRQLWLLAYTNDTQALPSRIAALQEAMSDTVFQSNDRLLHITADGLQWSRLARCAGEPEPGTWDRVVALDPVVARMWTLACRAGLHQTRTMQREAGERVAPDVLATARRIRHEAIGRRRATNPEHLAAADRRLLAATLADPRVPAVPTLVELGLALAEHPVVLAEAIEAVWAAKNSVQARIELWQGAARIGVDDARATALALVALAAWRTGDLATATSALELALGEHCPLAELLADVIAYGVAAADLDHGAPLVSGHLVDTGIGT